MAVVGIYCKESVMGKILEVAELKVVEYKLNCPYCGELEEGFYGDCRGQGVECDSCGEEYKIHSEADFEMY